MDMEKRVTSLIDITSHLIDLLERENQELRKTHSQGVAHLLDEKNALTRSFEAHALEFSKATEQSSDENEGEESVDPNLAERLQGLTLKVHGLIEDNARLLKVAMTANQQVVDLVAEAVKSSNPGPDVYSARGSMTDGSHRGTPRHASLSIDQSL
jgi:flagellar biosynthesis/type III secretory pathway chaperone